MFHYCILIIGGTKFNTFTEAVSDNSKTRKTSKFFFFSKETPEDGRTRLMIIQVKRHCKFKLPKVATDWNSEILL